MLDLTVSHSTSAYHSGAAGGIIPETFRIARCLLDRLDDSKTGRMCKELEIPVPESKMEEAKFMAKKCGESMFTKYSVHPGCKCMDQDNIEEMYLNNVWRANVSVTGAEGLPPMKSAGNVVRSSTSLRLSCRLPPGFNPSLAT